LAGIPFLSIGAFKLKILLYANTDWYLFNFRRSLARALCNQGHDVLLLSPPGLYGEKLKSEGFRWIPAPMDRRSLNPLHEMMLLGWLWRLMRQERPDLVHGFTIKCAVYGAVAARFVSAGCINAVAGVGYVFTSNELKARLLRPVVLTLMRTALGGKRSRLILQNPDDVNFFIQTRIVPRQQIRLIRGSGVDCSRFVPPDVKQESVTGPFRVVLAARLLWDKGLAEFAEAARLLKAEKRMVHFLLAGDPDPGNPAEVPKKTILAWQAEGLLHWLGHVTDMPSLLASADVVVLPSYYGEGLPKCLIEAAACARPLITTDMPGCREVVTHGVDGLLVRPRDAKALARAIADLQDNPSLAHELGHAAREKALLEFDESVVIQQTLLVYKEIVD
jgi:glycosyltransferase involved in cell wall biosynthesis